MSMWWMPRTRSNIGVSTVGMLQDDGLRVILDGLKPDDWVVVGGLQQVRPRMQIKPEQIPMPSLGPAESSTARQVETESSPKAQRG